LNDGDAATVKANILADVKSYAETEMGIKRVDEKFLIKMVKDIACNK